MLLAFQASAFDRSAICPGSAAPHAPGGATRGAHHNNLLLLLLLFRRGRQALIGIERRRIVQAGLVLARFLSGVLRGGTFRALRVLGASSPGGACNGGTSCAPA